MPPLAHLLTQQPFVILDGALATELERRGCDLHDPLWSAKVLLEHPDLIRAVHADYFAAGADCATTASYQATLPGFASRGIDAENAAGLMRLSVQLAAQARDTFWANTANHAGRVRPFIAGSVGPYGASLHDGSEYRGDYDLSVEALQAFHRPRIAALVEAGADVLAFETIPQLREALALAQLLREFPGMTAWMSFSARDGAHISSGEPLAACVAALEPYEQIAAVGVNCTPPEYITDLVRAAAGATHKPLLTYPNSGEGYDAASGGWTGDGCAAFADLAHEWIAAGARLLGGCCRTTPDDIRALASLRSAYADR